MSARWNIVKPDELARSIPNAPLKDGHIGVSLAKASVEEPMDVGVAGLSFSIGAAAEVKVEAFKRAEDEDEDGVVGVKTPAPPPPPLPIDGKHAWLKFSTVAQAKARAGVALPYVIGSGSAAASLTIADYHVHALSENARTAAARDITELRLPFVLDHVLRLAPNEAVALTARAKLATEIEVSWADVFSTGLGALTSMLPAGSGLSIEIDAGASVGAIVSITDDFTLVFSREKAGRVLATVHKASLRGGKVPFHIGVDVRFDGLDTALGAVLDGLLGSVPVARFEALLAKLDKAAASLAGAVDVLGEAERALFEAALERLGLAKITGDAARLEAAWKAFVAGVRRKIQTIAESKLTSGFEYEYSRVREREAIAELDVADADLAALHPLLLTARLDAALEEAGAAALRSYFRRDEITWEHAWGFTLGFGKWQLLASHDRKKLTAVVEYGSTDRVNGPVRISYLGVRSYEDTWFGSTTKLGVDFRCETDGFVKRPSAADLTYGLYLLMAFRGKPSGRELRDIVDTAATWGILDERDEKKVLDQIGAAGHGQKVDARIEVKLDDRLVRALALRFSQRDITLAARALARALPWDTVATHTTPGVRQRVFTEVWLAYLLHQDWFRDGASAARPAAAAVGGVVVAPPRAPIFWRDTTRCSPGTSHLRVGSADGGHEATTVGMSSRTRSGASLRTTRSTRRFIARDSSSMPGATGRASP